MSYLDSFVDIEFASGSIESLFRFDMWLGKRDI